MRSNRTGHPTHTIGQYRGVDFITHRLGDIFPRYFDTDVPALRKEGQTWWIFEYDDHKATGNHFKTKAEFESYIDGLLDTTEEE